MSALRGVVPVLETPFRDDGVVDRAGFRSVVEHALNSGVDGVMFPGYASESLKLSEGERAKLTGDMLELTRDRAEITGVVSVGEHATVRAVAEARRAVDLGADAVNVLPPYLLAPPGDAVVAHLESVLAAVAPIPVVVQLAPAQTGTTLGVHDLARLAESHANLAAVKVDAAAAGTLVAALRSAAPRLDCFVGYAGLHLPETLAQGATGVWPGSSFPEVYVELWRRWQGGDTSGFAELHRRLLPYLSTWMQHVELIVQVEKTISLRRRLITHDYSRAPGHRLDQWTSDQIDAFLEEFAPWFTPARASEARDRGLAP